MRRGLGIRGRIRIGLAAAFTAAALGATAPSAGAAGLDGLRHARYCEIFTVVLAPSPAATVWNTTGLNNCPGRWWDGLDTGDLATQHAVPLAVLNGPRHWVVDGASEPQLGPVSDFAGQELRDVATIDLASIGTAHPPPYTTVEIGRDNTWHYDRGKRVYDLVDPAGRVYRMQAFSQIVDPSLTYRQLRDLGARLALPSGWRFRVSRLSRSLDVTAHGTATILQDELQDTYQRLPKRFDVPPAGDR